METLFVGKTYIKLNEVSSTNNYITDLLNNNKQTLLEGLTVFTQCQTAGKGQRGNVWKSEVGKNLLVSYLFYPKFLIIKDYFNLNIFVSLAMTDLLKNLLVNDNYDIKIKWPNDIYVNNKKIAGILIENSFQKYHIAQSVIGIGININQINFEDLSDKATSLKLLTKKDFEAEEILNLYSYYLEKRYLQLKSSKKNLKIEYLNFLFRRDILAKYKYHNKIIDAKIENVADDGRLILNFKEEKIYCDMKEIVFLKQ